MCGICGVYNFDNTHVDQSFLKIMNDEMLLRGPDDSGYYLYNNFGMAMRRLSIIDIKDGSQPMSSFDQSIHVIFNGEIFNYLELKKKLISEGYNFRTNSDTEVIIALYKKYDENFINELNGMFSICLFDKKKNITFIIRDRIGIKPLFYKLNDKSLIFSSNLNSLKKVLSNLTISKKNFLLYMSLNYAPNSESIYEGIYKLKPGHLIKICNNKADIIQYWQIPKIKKKISRNDYYLSLKNLITDSVKIQSRSDVPVGSMLSGGLDSALVTILFSRQINHPIKSFCIDFQGKEVNENEGALEVSKKINSIHHHKIITEDDFFSTIDQVTKLMDEPIADNAIIPSYILSKIAKENNVKVLLSGAGGDEIFSGYSRHYESIKNLLHGCIGINSFFSKQIIKIIPKNLKNYFYKISNSVYAYASSTSGVNIATVLDMLREDKNLAEELIEDLELIFEPFFKNNNNNYKEKVMLADLCNYLPDNVLSLLDKTTMMNSIEGRVPLLDHRIVDLVYSSNINKFSEKKFADAKKNIKETFLSDLPSFIINKKKIGFNAPLIQWHKSNYDFFSKNFFLSEFYDLTFKKNFEKSKKLNNIKEVGTVFALNIFSSWMKNNSE